MCVGVCRMDGPRRLPCSAVRTGRSGPPSVQPILQLRRSSDVPVSLPLSPLPPHDRPDLSPADWGGPVVEPKHPGAMVRFLDGSWRLCTVIEWRQDPDGWACHLQWGVSGRTVEGWYQYDPEKVTEP